MELNLSAYQIKRKISHISYNLFRYLIVIGVCYLLLFPLFYLIISAIQDPKSMEDATVVWVPKVLSLENFKNAFELLDFGNSFVFSVIISAVSTILTLISCSMVGYGFARYNFAEKNIAFLFVILLIIVPPQTTMMSTYLNFRFFDFLGLSKVFGFDSINMLGSPLTLFLPALFANGIRSGLSIFIFRQFFLGQPKELEEAAKIDGCGIFGTYLKIMIPLSEPAIITVGVFSFVWYWNDSFYSDMFFSDGIKPLAVGLETIRNNFLADINNSSFSAQEQRGILAAASILCILAPLVFYVIIQRRFVESIEHTGIVG